MLVTIVPWRVPALAFGVFLFGAVGLPRLPLLTEVALPRVAAGVALCPLF